MKLTAEEKSLLDKLLKKANLKDPPKPVFKLNKSAVARIEAAFKENKRLVLVKGKTGLVSCYTLDSYLSKVTFGETRGVKTLKHQKQQGGGRWAKTVK